jgi:hypothetical protein
MKVFKNFGKYNISVVKGDKLIAFNNPKTRIKKKSIFYNTD